MAKKHTPKSATPQGVRAFSECKIWHDCNIYTHYALDN